MTGYALCDPPRYASLTEVACHLCGHESLQRPVWLRTPEGRTVAAGTGCAALALYGDAAQGRRARAAAADYEAARSAQEHDRAEWRAAAAQALLDLSEGRDGTPAVRSCRLSFHAHGGLPVLGSFMDWLERAAETGLR